MFYSYRVHPYFSYVMVVQHYACKDFSPYMCYFIWAFTVMIPSTVIHRGW